MIQVFSMLPVKKIQFFSMDLWNTDNRRILPQIKRMSIMKKIMFSLLFATITLANTTPNLLIKGQVLDATGTPLAGVTVSFKEGPVVSYSDQQGKFEISIPKPGSLLFAKPGYNDQTLVVTTSNWYTIKMQLATQAPVDVIFKDESMDMMEVESVPSREYKRASGARTKSSYAYQDHSTQWNTESYSTINENIFHSPLDEPLSTFSIDVDVASYSNMRRFIMNGQKPPIDAVRVEELINYFSYDYPQPDKEAPFSINTELIKSPWNNNQLLRIGLQGKTITKDELPASNLVFLLDVSGSMSSANKLPLLKSSFKLLVSVLRPQDRVAIVVYAGAAGLVLPSTSGSEKETIMAALDKLEAGGSTAGGAGIKLAYSTAMENLIENGNNRVIIATDGDFNIGASSDAAMERLISTEKEKGIFLTVLGFGMGNYKDSKMEILADKGNGNYAYIDSFKEANKVLSREFGGTLFTIAKDVKLQIEFNPAHVKSYRLIGYENRILQKEDFNNDKKDAGDMGSGHSVTAIYEIVPTNGESVSAVDPLKYQVQQTASNRTNELSTIKLRYKDPKSSQSKLLVSTIGRKAKNWDAASLNTRWAATVAAFGMYTRESSFLTATSIGQISEWANEAIGDDSYGYRQEFIDMMALFNQI
jgi:Ca-activated chloride channel family protein